MNMKKEMNESRKERVHKKSYKERVNEIGKKMNEKAEEKNGERKAVFWR